MAEKNTPPGTPEKTSPGNSPRFPPGFMVAASPPRFVSFDQLMASADGVTNMALAHQIAVDAEFKLEKVQPQESSIEKQVRDVMEKAFWDSLQEKLATDPPDYSHAVVLMEEVKQIVLSIMLPQHQRMRSQINEVFDMDLIRQKVANDAFDISYYAGFVISVMEKLCAPARDEQIAQLKTINEIVPLYKAIFAILDLMKMDMANFTIQQMRPYIQQQSVEYEKTKFQTFLTTQQSMGVDGLQFTRDWLKRSVEVVKEKTPITLLNEAYLTLLEWDQNHVFPETMLMDQDRFHTLQLKTELITLVSAALLVIYNVSGQPVAGIEGFKDKLKSEVMTILEGVPKSELLTAMQGVTERVKKCLNECLQQHGYPVLSSQQEESLKQQLTDVVEKGHPVHQIIRRRVFGFLREMMGWRANTPQLQIPSGLSAVSAELSNISGQFLRLISHNRAVFGSYYAEIISTLISIPNPGETNSS